ncbi:hypothetical protein RQP46_001125 [Phenoliferia psychrophenolica]
MPSHHDVLQQIRKIIPPLSPELHKGQAGRIGVVGGSKDYAGAPFFSSMAALRLGADLAHVICEPSAGNVIKTYSPDLIVHTDLHESSSEEDLTKLFSSLIPRLHVLVIGPGLGRTPTMQLAAKVALKLAREQGLYVCVDADGLWLVQNEPEVVKGYRRCVLTPNVVEFKRLCDSVHLETKDVAPATLARKLSAALGGVTILQKGAEDRITNGGDGEGEELVNDVEGSVRRCGGQGDVLSGLVGTFLAWGKSYEERVGKDSLDVPLAHIPLLAAYAGSTVTREASRMTFGRMRRAMQTSDMLHEVGPAYEKIFGEATIIIQCQRDLKSLEKSLVSLDDVAINDIPAKQAGIDSAVAAIQALGRKSVGVVADVTDEEQVENMIAKVVAALGSLDCMVANAGICKTISLLQMTAADRKAIIDVNVHGLMNSYICAAKQMVKQGKGGRIIGAASIAAYSAHPSLATLTLVQQYGIRVNAYAPGIVQTDMCKEIDQVLAKENGLEIGAVTAQQVEGIALGRASVPEDVAKLVSFLASDDSEYITGQTMICDGGIYFT